MCLSVLTKFFHFQMHISDVPVSDDVTTLNLAHEIEDPQPSAETEPTHSRDTVQGGDSQDVPIDTQPPPEPADESASDTQHQTMRAQDEVGDDDMEDDTIGATPLSGNDTLDNPKKAGSVNIGVIQMPSHLKDMDPMWSANEMRMLQKKDTNAIITRFRVKPVQKSRMLIPLCRLVCYPRFDPSSTKT